MNLKKTKEVEKLQFVELMRYKKHIRIINKAGGFITRLSAFFYASRGYFKGASKRHTIYRLKWRKCPFGPIIAWIHMLHPGQDPPVYYSIVILTILYYLRVADLMGITSPYPRENIIAGNYILADTQTFLSKCYRQQNKEILIRHSPGIGECFLFSNIQLTEKIKKISSGGCKNKKLSSRACIYALHLLNICKDIFEPA